LAESFVTTQLPSSVFSEYSCLSKAPFTAPESFVVEDGAVEDGAVEESESQPVKIRATTAADRKNFLNI
jgi:hypothetical protein